ncbi:MAG: hypothetical protein ACOH5I_09360 [Oligoflexus sp.]
MKFITSLFCLGLILGGCGLASFRSAEVDEDLSRVPGDTDAISGAADASAAPNSDGSQDTDEDISKIRESEANSLESFVELEEVPSASAWQTKQCSEGQQQTISQKLLFPQRKSCHFSSGDNLEKRAGYMQAYEKQQVVHNLPDNVVLCSMELTSQDQNLQYGDYLFLTLNDHILVASEIGWANFFLTDQGTKSWNWDTLKGQQHTPIEIGNQYGTPYCLGDTNCQVPKHDEAGPFAYGVQFAETNPEFYKSLELSKVLEFHLMVTGDDDHHDCFHTKFDLDLVINYVVPSK